MLMVGYGCVRLRFYGQTALDGMCSLLLNVLIPLLVFSNAMAGADRAQVEANWGAMLLTAVMYALLILVFRLVAWALRLKGSRSHVFQAALIFGNAGFHRHSDHHGVIAARGCDLRRVDVDRRSDAAMDVRRMAVRAGSRTRYRRITRRRRPAHARPARAQSAGEIRQPRVHRDYARLGADHARREDSPRSS